MKVSVNSFPKEQSNQVDVFFFLILLKKISVMKFKSSTLRERFAVLKIMSYTILWSCSLNYFHFPLKLIIHIFSSRNCSFY